MRRHVLVIVLLASFLQILYLLALPISYEGDASGYFSYAKLFAHMGGWFQYWRPPGFPIYLHVLGMTWAQTFVGVIAVNAVMGISMPLLVYGTLRPVGERTAFAAALLFTFSTLPFSYAKVFISEHPYSFFLLLGVFGLSRFIATQDARWSALVCAALLAALMMRNEAIWIAVLSIVMMLAIVRNDWKKLSFVAACALVALSVTMAWSWKRSEIMSEPKAFGSLHNFSGRQLFWRVYYAVGNGSVVSVQSENGPATQQLSDMLPIGMLDHPSHENNWTIGETVVRKFGVVEGDIFLKRVVRETIAAHPKILTNFAVDALNFLGINLDGPLLVWHYDAYETMPFNIANTAVATMTPGLMEEYTRSHRRESKRLAVFHRVGQTVHNVFRIGVGITLLLTVWFLPFTRHRWLGVFLLLSSGMLIGAGTLGFGFNVRYEHMILPFLLMTATLAFDTATRVLLTKRQQYLGQQKDDQ